MIQRFTGPHGQQFVVDALRTQIVIGGDENLAQTISSYSEVIDVGSGSTIIEESAFDNDIWFILAGVVSIRVLGREIAVRSAGHHIGEMAVVDPTQSRSASAVAEGNVVLARLSAVEFNRIADSYPRLWRNIARELAQRLRQRNRFVAPTNPRPVLFIGSSAESLPVARAIESAFAYDPVLVKSWTTGIFKASSFPIEALEGQLANVDFAAMVVSPDDRLISRGQASHAPRDNIIFELGFFMGVLGRSRTFLVSPRGTDIKIPTDLNGITVLTYDPGEPSELPMAVSPACNELRTIMLTAGPR